MPSTKKIRMTLPERDGRLVVDNLLGIHMEGWPRYRILARYPAGVREIAALDGNPDDDDLAQAIIGAKDSLKNSWPATCTTRHAELR